MSWGKLDDKWHQHPKVLRCSLAARGLWTTVFSWLRDNPALEGFIPLHMIEHFAGHEDWQPLDAELTAIVEPYRVGLWDVTQGGRYMHDFERYNPTPEQIAKKRKQTKIRVRRLRERNADVTCVTEGSNAVTLGMGNRTVSVSRKKKLLEGERGMFQSWWERYPKKKARKDALIAWRKLNPSAFQAAVLMAAVEAQRMTGKFVPNGATWLNGERWEDTPDEAVVETARAPLRVLPNFTGCGVVK